MKMLVLYYLLIHFVIIDIIKGGCRLNKAGLPVCSQLCAENAEQITCGCLTGYVLADDKRTCLVTGEEPKLVFVSWKKINIYLTEAGDVEPLTGILDSQVTDIGFGPDNSLLFVSNDGTVVYKTSLDGNSTRRKPVPLIDTGLRYVTSVAVDWITSNIYLVDRKGGTIIVCAWQADKCSVLIRDLERPHSAVLDIKSKKLLWTEWGSGSHAGSIRTSDLDGTQHTLLLSDLDEPRNLVLDVTVGDLFWVEKTQSGYSIQSWKLKSEQRKVYTVSPGFTAPSVSVLSDKLYVIRGEEVLVINKFTGKVLHKENLGTGNITVASIYHPVLYDTQDVADPCKSSPCSHLCVLSNSRNGYRCFCPVDMETDVTGKCTRKDGIERLLVASMTGIYEIPRGFVGSHDYQGHRLVEGEVNCLVYDSVKGRIFYYDDDEKAVKVTQRQNPKLKSMLYKEEYPVEGMAHDPSSHTIYWTTTQGKVFAGREDGTFSVVIQTGLYRPRGITVDSENGYMYICDWGGLPQILKCYMDGTHCETFINVEKGHPNMVVIAPPVVTQTHDQKKALYWTDSKLDMIGYSSLDGVYRGEIRLNYSVHPHPYSLAVTDNTIYFTDLNSKLVHYLERSNLNVVNHIQLGSGSVYGMDHVWKSAHVPKTACSEDIGGCSYICLVKPKGQRSCLCPDSKGNSTCTERKELHSHEVPEGILYERNFTQASSPAQSQISLLLIVLPSAGLVLLLLVIIVVVFCYLRYKKRKQGWTLKFVHYMKSKKEDVQGLVTGSTLSIDDANFKQFMDIDYPEDKFCQGGCLDRTDGRETSMISADSAFTEMKDFDTYSSVDNIQQ